jgi:ribosomal protein S12 methylthiotransferase accessory factor
MMASTAEVIVTLEEGARVVADVAGYRLETDQPVEDGGQNTAPSPYLLFLGSLASCAGFFVSSFCRKRGLSTDGIRIRQRVQNDPTTGALARVEHMIEVPPDFPQKYVGALTKVVDGCSVKRAIQAQPTFTCQVTQRETVAGAPPERPAPSPDAQTV